MEGRISRSASHFSAFPIDTSSRWLVRCLSFAAKNELVGPIPNPKTTQSAFGSSGLTPLSMPTDRACSIADHQAADSVGPSARRTFSPLRPSTAQDIPPVSVAKAVEPIDQPDALRRSKCSDVGRSVSARHRGTPNHPTSTSTIPSTRASEPTEEVGARPSMASRKASARIGLLR